MGGDNFDETASWDPVRKLKRTDACDAGADGDGPLNLAPQTLTNRDAYLRSALEAEVNTRAQQCGALAQDIGNEEQARIAAVSSLSSLISTKALQSAEFTASGNWTAPFSGLVLLIGYGGGGGGAAGYLGGGGIRGSGGGGGAAASIGVAVASVVEGTTYTVTIGAGGAGGLGTSSHTNPAAPGQNGSNTKFGDIVFAGAGGGGGGATYTEYGAGGAPIAGAPRSEMGDGACRGGNGAKGDGSPMTLAQPGCPAPVAIVGSGLGGAVTAMNGDGGGGSGGPGGPGGAGGLAPGGDGGSVAANSGAGGGGGAGHGYGGTNRSGDGKAGGSGRLWILWMG